MHKYIQILNPLGPLYHYAMPFCVFYYSLFPLQWYETRNKILRKKNWKIHKYVIKQHTTEQPTIQRKTKRGIKKYLKTNEDGKRTYQNIQDGAKAILRRNSVVIQA